MHAPPPPAHKKPHHPVARLTPTQIPSFISQEELQHVGKVGELEEENRRLQKELEEFHKEFQEIQNQEVTVRRLEERLREYETEMDELVASKIAARERELMDEHAREALLFEEREAETQRQLTVARAELLAVRQAYDGVQASLFDLKLKHGISSLVFSWNDLTNTTTCCLADLVMMADDNQEAKQAQVELLVSEVERAQSSIAALERERDRLKEQLAAAPCVPPQPDLEIMVAQKDMEVGPLFGKNHLVGLIIIQQSPHQVANLQEQVQQLQMSLGQSEQAHAAAMETLQAQVQKQNAEINSLQKQLQASPSASEVQVRPLPFVSLF